MIISIDSSIPTFKKVKFKKKGLSVLVSDRRPNSDDGETRNSAGKTSLIEIIHFLHGAKCDKTCLFRSSALIDHTFFGKFEIKGVKFRVERSGEIPSRIYLSGGYEKFEDMPTNFDKKKERDYISNENWKLFLGNVMFGLPLDPIGTLFEQTFTPSFRSMFSYFARNDNSGGFTDPVRNAEKQQRWDWQENLSYLFNLDWRISREFQGVSSRESQLKALKKLAKSGGLESVVGSTAELRSKVTVADKQAADLRTQLKNFEVHESYSELSASAAEAKSEMQSLVRANISLRENKIHLESALEQETPPGVESLESIYRSAGVQLPDLTLRHLDSVEVFYTSVIANRVSHLKDEIEAISNQINDNEAAATGFDEHRQEILKILESKGALEDLIDLQEKLAELESVAANLKEQFKNAKVIEGEDTQLDIDRSQLLKRLQNDFADRQAVLDEAILAVSDTIDSLYHDRDGGFKIEATNRGPDFKVFIDGDRGGGIGNMEVFCLDLALLRLNAKIKRGPGFLVHDSHLFDGVDERQIAKALTLAAGIAKDNNLQYIVTMNSDIFDRIPLPETLDRAKIALKARLSDETNSGGLFGFKFN